MSRLALIEKEVPDQSHCPSLPRNEAHRAYTSSTVYSVIAAETCLSEKHSLS